jgi:ABC-type dipeptide/oligopeptide/nickel transport system permease subunit
LAQSATELRQGLGGGAGGPAHEAEGPGVVALSPRQLFWRRFKEDKMAIFGGILVLLMVGTALLAPLAENISGHEYDQLFDDRLNSFGTPLGPTSEFWWGSDTLGRDVFVRSIFGARVSLTIAIIATGIELAIGVFLGLLAGFSRGWIDTVVSRFIDLILSVPFLLLGISLSVTLGGGKNLVIFVIAFFGWPYIARIVRGQTLSLREAQFVEAAYSLGGSSRWIMFREILPNLVAPIIIYATLIIPQNILAEAGLSYLGVGINEPTAAWGKMLSDATPLVSAGAAWWFMFYPGLLLFITVLGFNLLGDGLRDALDPKTGR